MSLVLAMREKLASAVDSDVFYSFRSSRLTLVATATLALIVACALTAPWIAPHNPFDISSLDLMSSELPPAWAEGGDSSYPLGTDTQARDVLSSILHGSRVSLGVGFASVLLAVVLGVCVGLVSGYAGGFVDALIMVKEVEHRAYQQVISCWDREHLLLNV